MARKEILQQPPGLGRIRLNADGILAVRVRSLPQDWDAPHRMRPLDTKEQREIK